MRLQNSHFFQYFRRDQTRWNISVSITIFLSQIRQRRQCPSKLSSGFVPPHCSLRPDNGVSLTSHNAERNSEGVCSTRRECLLGISPVLLTRRSSSSQMFSIMFKSGDLDGKSTAFTLFAFRYAEVALARWAGAPTCKQLHSSVVFKQCNDLHIQHFMLIALCS